MGTHRREFNAPPLEKGAGGFDQGFPVELRMVSPNSGYLFSRNIIIAESLKIWDNFYYMEKDVLPVEFNGYFWDIDTTVLSVTQNTFFIIERFLEYGNEKAIQWLLHQYSKDEISNVVRTSRRLSARSANFWVQILDIPVEEVLCLSKSFRNTCRAIWKH